MDIEGHEKEVLLNTTFKDWENMDALVEIENAENAAAIYKHFIVWVFDFLLKRETGWKCTLQMKCLQAIEKEHFLCQ